MRTLEYIHLLVRQLQPVLQPRGVDYIPQKALAAYLHIAQNTYSQYENGVRQLPLDALIKLAIYFDTSTDYILGLTDVRKPYPRKK